MKLNKSEGKNIGFIDRLLRFLLGVLIVYYGLMIESYIAIVGTLVIFIAIVAKCPLYKLLGISTYKPLQSNAENEDTSNGNNQNPKTNKNDQST